MGSIQPLNNEAMTREEYLRIQEERIKEMKNKKTTAGIRSNITDVGRYL